MKDLNLSPPLAQAVKDMGFTEPTPIQRQSIPVLMDGRDLIGQADTGTGKTAAFAIPAIEKVDLSVNGVQVLILTPTRELALQVLDEVKKLSQFRRGLRSLAIYGGQSISQQMNQLSQPPHIVVGTPGRLLDMIGRRKLNLSKTKTVILDEADEMLNMGFRPDIESILAELPQQRQTVLFSATMSPVVLGMAKRYQTKPVHVQVNSQPQDKLKISQSYFEVHKNDKMSALLRLMRHHKPGLTIVFCNTKWKVDHVTQKLKQMGFDAEALHGGKTQGQRNAVMRRFHARAVRILVATDVAARGLDVNDVEAVINYDLPKDDAFYVHRIGRTGRAGKSGSSFTFVEQTEGRQLKRLRKQPGVALLKQELPA